MNKCKCGNKIHKDSKLCRSCSQKMRLKNPKHHPSYIDGRTLKKYYCKDCGKELSSYLQKRCLKCYRKLMSKRNFLRIGIKRPEQSKLMKKLHFTVNSKKKK